MGTMYKAVFISDLHLGSKHCQCEKLFQFLETLETQELFLVGDIIDGWRLSKKWYWPKKHGEILNRLLSFDAKVHYIPGNHDEFLRGFINLASILKKEAEYIAVDGKRFLVVHGDLFDQLMRSRFGRKIMSLGDGAYDFLAHLNVLVNKIRSFLGYKHWSLSKYLKQKAKTAANFIGSFEEEMVKYCKANDYDGIICGHIHSPNIRSIDGIIYMNDGDWCESASALVEHLDGTWEILYL